MEFKVKLLGIFLILSNPVVAGDNFVSNFSRHFSKTSDPIVLVLFAIALVLLVACLVVWEIKKAESLDRKKSDVGWQRFFAIAQEKRMVPEQIKLLKDILSFSDSPNVAAVFSSLLVFENAIEAYFEQKLATLDQNTFEDIRNLREKLGYLRLPEETPYLSTRHLQAGQSILVIDENTGNRFAANIRDVNEKWIEIDNSVSKAKVGDPISFSHTRMGDGEYTIFSKIERVTAQSLVVEHTRSLVRKQLRNWVRIEISQPLEVIVKSTKNTELTNGSKVIGKIKDLSGGGLSLAIPYQLNQGDQVICSFHLAKVPMKSIQGKIIRVVPKPSKSDQLYTHSMEFVDLETQDREKVVRYVFDRQRQDVQWR
jgi:hypothetical protein